MAISTRWDINDVDGCRKDAENRAGESEHGYLYRLYWSSKKECIRLIAYPILKITPQCFKIHPQILKKPIYVSRKGFQKYAQSDTSSALESYRARRKAMIRRLEFRLMEARKSLSLSVHRDPALELYWLQDEEDPIPGEAREDLEELEVV